MGAILRALRRRRGFRQSDLASIAGVSQSTISLVERGHLGRLSISAIRTILQVVDARFDGNVLWRSGDVDRLLDSRHASIQQHVAGILSACGWQVVPEVSYSRYGERGSIDLVGLRIDTRCMAVFEIKSEVPTLEATHRKHDEKVRLAPSICFERWGWRPIGVGRILVMPESRQLRRLVNSHSTIFRAAYPASSWQVRRWLQQPTGSLSGLWFLSSSDGRGAKRIHVSRARVRRPPDVLLATAMSVSPASNNESRGMGPG